MSLQRRYWLVLSVAVTGAVAASPGYLPAIGPSRLRFESPVTTTHVPSPLPPLVTPSVFPPDAASTPPAAAKPEGAKVPEPVMANASPPLTQSLMADTNMTNTIAAPAANSESWFLISSIGPATPMRIARPWSFPWACPLPPRQPRHPAPRFISAHPTRASTDLDYYAPAPDPVV